MIAYILLSYIIMLVMCLYFIIFDGEDIKPNFKYWLFSPVTMPMFFIGLFISW